MTDWRSLRGSNFLTWEDLENGPALVTITGVRGEEMLDDDEKVKKEIAVTIDGWLQNKETGEVTKLAKTEWVANVVNCELLEHLFGTPHYEEWVGRKALLRKEPCEVAGKFFGKPSVRVHGGPDITEVIRFDIVLKMKGGKKRKPIPKTLHPTGGARTQEVSPGRQQPQNGDASDETGLEAARDFFSADAEEAS